MTLSNLFKNKPYPGRFILIGKLKNKYTAIYGVTGRSASSLNRIYKKVGNKIVGKQTDYKLGGNQDLLEYPAYVWNSSGLIVANGNQIKKAKISSDLGKNLEYLKTETVEPDEYLTPRITGFILKKNNRFEVALHAIRSIKNKVRYDSYRLSLKNNQFFFISTYIGKDVRPTPSFSGKPIVLDVKEKSLDEIVRTIFDSLTPKKRKGDYRVSIMGVEFGGKGKSVILNKLEN